MKNILNISDSTENRISYWHLVIFLWMLPFDRYLSQITLISFCLHTLIHAHKAGWQRILTRENLILSSVWWLSVFTILLRNDLQYGWKECMQQLGLVLFPAVISLTNFPLVQYRQKLLLCFAWAVVTAVIYLYLDAGLILFYYHFKWTALFSPAFINQHFSSPLGIHATYLALLLALAAAIFLQEIFSGRTASLKKYYIAALAVLSAGLLQLGSRSVLISCGLFLLIPLPFFMASGRKRMLITGISVLVLIAGSLLIAENPVFRTRYIADLREDLRNHTDISSRTPEPRLVRWKLIAELIHDNPMTGYGIRGADQLLEDTYYNKHLYISWLLRLNTHNQYLSQWLRFGLPGILLFLFWLYWGFRQAWKRRDFIFVSLMISIAVVCFSENILEVNKGIFYTGFFLSFFLKSGKPEGE